MEPGRSDERPDDPYLGRLQTKIKHEILRRCLQRFARIVGRDWRGVTYVDCFAGPWESKAPDYSDTSFGIALAELRSARETVKETWGREFQARMLLLEKNPDNFSKLEEFSRSVEDVYVRPIRSELEDAVPSVVNFIQAEKDCFPFVFIDPFGWTGFSMERIKPILTLDRLELLINFQSEYVNRFVGLDSPANREQFDKLYGVPGAFEAIHSLHENVIPQHSVEEAAVRLYCQRLGVEANFPHVARALVLHGDKDRVYFNMLLGTRHPKGIEVFKGAERRAMEVMDLERARFNFEKTQDESQSELFDTSAYASMETNYFAHLRAKFLFEAFAQLREMLDKSDSMPFDSLWFEAMKYPIVQSRDLTDWIADKNFKVDGLAEKERVPKLGKNHIVRIGN